MYCTKCGANLHGSLTCPSCGASSGRAAAESGRIQGALSTPLFLTLCVLLSVAALSSLLFFVSAAVLALLAVACWMMYCAAKNSRPISEAALSLADGTAAAMFIIGWVQVGLCGIIAVFSLMLASKPWLYHPSADLTATGFTFFGFPLLLVSICLFVYAVISVFVTLFYTRNLKKFIHSVRLNTLDSRVPIQKAGAVKSWLMALGIFELVVCALLIGVCAAQTAPPIGFLLPSLISLLLKVCIHITGYILIKRYFSFCYSE